jgi:hypothetical protein
LQDLELASTKVTDVGLRELKVFKSLKTLNLFSTEVTDAGVADLREALPGLAILR